MSKAFERRELAIEASFEHVRDARQWAESAARAFGLTPDDCYAVKLAMSEAVANAIQHGSSSSADSVRLAAWAEGSMLRFEVVDQGASIAPPNPLPDNGERGRGLEIVAMVMDEVRMVGGAEGSLLCFSKRRDAA